MVTRETLVRDLEACGLDVPAERIDLLRTFEQLVRTTAIERGLIGPNEADNLYRRHILDCAVLAPLLPSSTVRAVDVGSGAGLPGLVLAIIISRPFTLLDAEARRTDFLAMAADVLGIRVDVIQGRSEDAGRDPLLRDTFDVAVARACAPPPVALELVLPFVRPGGRAILAVGPSVRDELRGSAAAAKVLAARDPRLVPLQVPGLKAERWAMVVEKLEQTPDKYPRRVGVPSRRPLGT